MAGESTGQKGALLPPQNLEAEEAVLGAMLANPGAIPVATDVLRGADFWRDTHRHVFEAIYTLYARGSEVDFITVSAELERQGALERVGGREFVHALTEGVPAATAVVHYAEIVREQSILRQLVAVGNEIAEMGYRHPDDVHVLLDRAEQKLFAVSQERRAKDFRALKDVLTESFQRITAAKETGGRRGVPTGFKDLDEKTEGLHPSNLIVLAARPSMGKTSLALNIAHHAAVDEKAAVAIFSLEMSVGELGDRLISAAARVGSHKLRNPRLLGDDDLYKIMRAISELEQAPIFIDDTAGLSMFELRSKARRLNEKERLSLIVVDYLQLMVGDGRAENRQQEVAAISRSLKQLARELEVPVVAVSQLNRAPETRGGDSREPQLSDLRESGAIEQDADLVLFLYEKEKGSANKGEITLKIAKHRNGPTGELTLGWVKDYTKFRTLAKASDYPYEG
jgi:replicative DNA helicase